MKDDAEVASHSIAAGHLSERSGLVFHSNEAASAEILESSAVDSPYKEAAGVTVAADADDDKTMKNSIL